MAADNDPSQSNHARLITELKSVSHDLFNVLTVMYGLQETLQTIQASPAADESVKRATTDFNQVVTRMQQIGQRILRLYRDDPPK